MAAWAKATERGLRATNKGDATEEIDTRTFLQITHSPSDDSGRSLPTSTGRTSALTGTLNIEPLHPVDEGRPLQAQLYSCAL